MKKVISLLLTITLVFTLGLAFASAEGSSLTGEFTVLHFNNEADTAGTSYGFWQAAKAFEAANPGVTINYEFVAHDDYEAYINTLMAGDSLPDVYLIKGDLVSTMADADIIYPEESIIQEDADWYAQYVPGAFSDGSGYTVPFQVQANCVVVYNQAIFDECGVDSFPATYDELLADIPKFLEKGYTPIGLGNGGQWLAPSCLLNTFCYRYVDDTWFSSLRNGEGAAWTDDTIVNALTDFQNLALAGAFNEDMNSLDQDGMYQLYYNQKCAMIINGAWMIGEMTTNCPEELRASTHVALMPAVEGGLGGTSNTAGGAGWGWTVNKSVTGDNYDAVQAFLKAITTGDYANNALSMGFFSAANTSEVDESTLDPIFVEYWKLEETMNFLPIWDVVLPASFGSGEYYASTQELLINAVSPTDMAQRLQDAWEAAQ